jgi:hypothetical protein
MFAWRGQHPLGQLEKEQEPCMAALATDSSVSAGPEGGTPTVSEDSVLKELTELRASCITPGRCREKYEIGRTLGRYVVTAS